MQFFFGSRDEATVIVSKTFLDNEMKCFRLFRCFKDNGSEEICQSIENSKCFSSKEISLEDTSLSPYDVECIALFLNCSPYKWKKLNLSSCHIQDYGLRVLHRDQTHSDVTIKEINLWNNDLTKLSSSFIYDLAIHCRVEELHICCNNTIVVKLEMLSTGFSSSSTTVLFTELAKGSKLQSIDIIVNSMTDDT